MLHNEYIHWTLVTQNSFSFNEKLTTRYPLTKKMATPLEDRSQNYCYFTSASNPLRLVPEMSYKVSSGTLNSAIRAHYLSIVLLAVLMMMMMMIPYHQLHRSLHLTIFGVPASLYLSTLWIAAVGGECPCN